MISAKRSLLFSLCAITLMSLPLVRAETPDQLPARYAAASAAQRKEIMEEQIQQRQAARLARFGGEQEGSLTREEWADAARAERQAWQSFQTERDRRIRAAQEQHQLSRSAALRQRRTVYRSEDISDSERAAIMETIRREQEAHRARRR